MKTKIASFFPALLLLLILTACGGGSDSPPVVSSAPSTGSYPIAPTDGDSAGSPVTVPEDDSPDSNDYPIDDGAADSNDQTTDDGAADSNDQATEGGAADSNDQANDDTSAESNDQANDDTSAESNDQANDDTSADNTNDEPAGITGGIAVDPYIVGATFFEDVNGNGRWDAGEGEQISTPSDEQGRFTFAKPVPAGNAIIMLERGTHQGLPFTGQLMHRVSQDDAGTVVVTPLTTLAARAFADGDISSLLTAINGYRGYDLTVDPMAGLAELNGSVNEDELADLRANLYMGALLDLFQVSREIAELNGQNLEPDNYELLYGLREGLLYATDPTAQNRIAALLPLGFTMPPVTMREVAESLPAILNWWKQELIGKALQGEPVEVTAEAFKNLVDAVQPELGLHYYLRRHQNDAGVQAAGLQPEFDSAYVSICRDNAVGPLETINYDALLGQSLVLGDNSRLRFAKDPEGPHGTVELSLGGNSLIGTWRIEEAWGETTLLILEDDDGLLELELEANRHSHLSLRVTTSADAYAPDSFVGRLLEATRQFTMAGS
ncbi:hypothetical protein ACHHRT_09000 [Desulfurivibrio sp. D14AmB]|uniref:hypothetical protein n=1 Tax=Desulfurivibrio sp. D14AmB TaxID=3374370 RepID=UPI00376ECB2E